ncbi:PAS domain S-box protein [Noviherbaspirillum sp. ST9]|uniref:PAS domain S-box protein n=1 Tax=Noviherbaspirillum sp. ST9 TaxID=3401606 RepID=UPI003B585C3F
MEQPSSDQSAQDAQETSTKNADNALFSFTNSLLQNSNDLIAAVDSELRLVGVNAHFLHEFELVFGIRLHSGQRLDEVLAHLTRDRDKVTALCRRALAGEAFRVVEDFGDEHLLRKTYELAFNPIFDTQHKPLFAAVVVRDVTLLRANEQRFGALLDAAPDATLLMRSDGTIDMANATAERLFGYGRQQMIGIPVEKLIPQRFHARHIAQRHQFALRPAARSMGSGRTDLLGLRADGSEFPVEISLNPLDVAGERMVVAAVRDMTLRQTAEDELRALSKELEQRVKERTAELEQANKEFKATFEQASVGIAHVGPNGKWLRVNQQLCEIVGYAKEEMASLTFQDITHPDDLDADLKLMYALLAGSIQSYSLDKRYIRKNGECIWINLNASLVRDGFGAPHYFIAVIKDINDRRRAEVELQRSKENFEVAIQATGLGMYDYAPQSGNMHWNPEMKRLFGLPVDAPVDYGDFIDVLHPADKERVDAVIQQALRSPASARVSLEYRIIRHDNGVERIIEARGQVFFDDEERPVRFIGTVLDISDKRRAEVTLRENERELRLLFDASPIGMVRRASSGEVLEANAAYLRIVGLSRDDLAAGRVRWDRLTAPEYLAADQKAMEQAFAHGVSDVFEKEYIRTDGTRIPVLLAFAAVGTGRNLVAFVLDISERKEAEERVRQTALHDPLTGLPNRSLLFDYAKHIFARARRAQHHSGILFVDLDRFKLVNDSHGHEVGDEVLREVARRMAHCTRADDMIFRLGGDEFLVLLPKIENDKNAGDVARHLLHCLDQPYEVSGLVCSISASIGISLFPRDGEDLDTLVNNADSAMYQAKLAGRNNIQFYSRELAARAQQLTKIEEQLKSALSEESFSLYYQPVIDTGTGELIGVEALIRWPYSDIGPDQFVPIAETTGHIVRLGDWVIKKACRQHKEWLEHGLPAIPIAVNVSAVQFRHKDFAEQFKQAMGDCEVDAAALQVELTETALMENLERAVEVLVHLKALGVKISLDDFGTGYSSLNYLSRLPINKIKIDKSFVQRLEHDNASRAITKAVIALARTLDLDVVAEGIESEAAMDYLRQHGCNQAQGYHVCRPVPSDLFEEWYRSRGSGVTH